MNDIETNFFSNENQQFILVFTPQPLRALGILFHLWCPDGLAFGRQEKVCLDCISKTIRCRKLILGKHIGLRGVSVKPYGVTLILPLTLL